eukprot:2260748-Rhodomonas_salina.2
MLARASSAESAVSRFDLTAGWRNGEKNFGNDASAELMEKEADRYVKKRKAFEERDERAAAVKKVVSCFPDHELDETWLPNDVCVFEQAEDDEVAEEVRGLPLEDRLQYAFEEAEEGEEEEGGEQTYIDDSDDSGDIDAKIIQGWESDKMSSPVPTTDVGSEIDRGAMQDCVGAHR